MTRAKRLLVAGVDGSESSMQAALWAAGEAQLLSAPLILVLVNNDPTRKPYAEEVVHDIRNRCQESVSELEISEEVTYGHPAEELVHRSASAQLVVVGSRGQGAFRDALLGSTSAAVATHASSPVVVVPGGGADLPGPVVAGVDDSPGCQPALRFAFDAANRRRSELVALQALPNAYFIPGPYDHPDRDELLAHAKKRLAEQLSTLAGSFPDVVVRQVVSNIPPVQALHEAAEHAQLLVLGHRGGGGFTGLLVGSVARGVLHHAPCPVAVVPG